VLTSVSSLWSAHVFETTIARQRWTDVRCARSLCVLPRREAEAPTHATQREARVPTRLLPRAARRQGLGADAADKLRAESTNFSLSFSAVSTATPRLLAATSRTSGMVPLVSRRARWCH
jgi:hypothetical protein